MEPHMKLRQLLRHMTRWHRRIPVDLSAGLGVAQCGSWEARRTIGILLMGQSIWSMIIYADRLACVCQLRPKIQIPTINIPDCTIRYLRPLHIT